MELGTQHYGVYSDDLDKSLEFYREVLGFKRLFTAYADEDGIPLKMAWIRNDYGVIIELLQQGDYLALDPAANCRNHIALRTADMDATVAELMGKGIVMEAGPFAATLDFDQEIPEAYRDTFVASGTDDVMLKVAFFRGPYGERFELMQDNLGAGTS